MVDIFPFPNVTSSEPEKQIGDIVNYLIQFKETLEFALMNISEDNLSQNLVDKLNSLGADIERSNEYREDETTQITQKMMTLSDVNSAIDRTISNIKFTVNFETGNLEYNTP